MDSSLPEPASLTFAILHLMVSFTLVDIFAYACSMSLFFCSSNHPCAVSLNLMYAFLSSSSSAWSVSVHGAGMLASSLTPAPPSSHPRAPPCVIRVYYPSDYFPIMAFSKDNLPHTIFQRRLHLKC